MNVEKLTFFLEEDDFSGNIFIHSRQETLFAKSYGYANREFKIKNSLKTVFPIASIGKMFTGIAILQLVATDQCSLDSNICRYIDIPITEKYSSVTIRELLTHSSGLSDYIDEGNSETFSLNEKNMNLKSIDDYMKIIQFSHYPTSDKGVFHYNNYGYIILGKIIENLTNQSFYEYIKKNIFLRANMISTSFFSLDEIVENRAEGYYKDTSNIWKKNTYSIPFKGASDGGAYSTIEDLYNFITAINDNKFLSKDYTKLFLKEQIFNFENDEYVWKYGLGNWFLFSKKNMELIRWGHPGEDFGVSARLLYYPNSDTTLIILSNVSDQAESILKFIESIASF